MKYKNFYVDILESYQIIDFYKTICAENTFVDGLEFKYEYRNYIEMLTSFRGDYKYDRANKVFYQQPTEIKGIVNSLFNLNFGFSHNCITAAYMLKIDDVHIPTTWRFILQKYRPQFFETAVNKVPIVYDLQTTKLLLYTFFSWRGIIEKELRLLADGYYADKYSTEA